jgi:hypothetical protein
MSGNLSTAALPASGIAAQAVLGHLPVPVAADAARATLPFTGIAVGAYVMFALALIIIGFVLRHLGTVGEA